MKKISLKSLNLDNVEQLSREELRRVSGGSGAGCDSGCSGGCKKDGVEGTCLKKSNNDCVCGTLS